MKNFIFVVLIFILHLSAYSQTEMNSAKEYTMLSLGDSYTIGEKVEEADLFPNQTVLLLHSKGIYFSKPKIIATTGWTTDELMHAIGQEELSSNYEFVTLLIGVNNQYRGRGVEEFRKEFVELLELSIKFSGGNKNQVVVLSIPDWGVTQFAEGRDRKKIAWEIDVFNSICKEESLKHKVHYIDITTFTREHPDWVAEDGLHPNGKMYSLWANELVKVIEQELK